MLNIVGNGRHILILCCVCLQQQAFEGSVTLYRPSEKGKEWLVLI
ncbi:hypothetical protein ACM67B_05215 [Neisseria sp. CCUG17229]